MRKKIFLICCLCILTFTMNTTSVLANSKVSQERIDNWIKEVKELPDINSITLENDDRNIQKLADEFKRINSDCEEEIKQEFLSESKNIIEGFFDIFDRDTYMYYFKKMVEELPSLENVIPSTNRRVNKIEEECKVTEFSDIQRKSLKEEFDKVQKIKDKVSKLYTETENDKSTDTSENYKSTDTSNVAIEEDSNDLEKEEKDDSLEQAESNKEDSEKIEKDDAIENVLWIVTFIVIIIIFLIYKYIKRKDEKDGYIYYK